MTARHEVRFHIWDQTGPRSAWGSFPTAEAAWLFVGTLGAQKRDARVMRIESLTVIDEMPPTDEAPFGRLNLACGKELDEWGRLYGFSRGPAVSDAEFRHAILTYLTRKPAPPTPETDA